jgi:hypothetical protein
VVILLALIATISPPKPDHYVTDRTGVVKNTAALNEKLAQFERQTSDQVLVCVVTEANLQELGRVDILMMPIDAKHHIFKEAEIQAIRKALRGEDRTKYWVLRSWSPGRQVALRA